MSSHQEFSIVPDPRLIAKFEQLYAARGSPEELDNAFVNEFFSAIAKLEGFNTPNVFPQPSMIDLRTENLHTLRIPAAGREFIVLGTSTPQAVGILSKDAIGVSRLVENVDVEEFVNAAPMRRQSAPIPLLAPWSSSSALVSSPKAARSPRIHERALTRYPPLVCHPHPDRVERYADHDIPQPTAAPPALLIKAYHSPLRAPPTTIHPSTYPTPIPR
ncbi:hypothetical protein HWV62_13565 [Athelia sp. TMB]|nr:hypothetical protein HWV62_13565 [Athelia sp. TMB]